MLLWLLLVWSALGDATPSGPVPVLERLEVYTTEAECRRARLEILFEDKFAVTDCLKAELTYIPERWRRE